MKTWSAKASDIKEKWWIVDAEGKTLGRMATEIANVLRGKNKPTFTPHVDTGDFVVVVNPEKIVLKGRKLDQKVYYRHTGFFGGLKETSVQEMLDKNPEQIIINAVEGMLPKNKLSRKIIKKLKVYKGSEHPHDAQQPEVLEIKA
ncbi:MAG: 50S ribosomal protein L13 [Bdellovibrionaceae bacterium]|nr:50S ribosomal protein L13 [Pseudobdellovibrionaceae bacterium]